MNAQHDLLAQSVQLLRRGIATGAGLFVLFAFASARAQSDATQSTSLTPDEVIELQASAIRDAENGEFSNPANCQGCHPVQFQEWQGSVMHYAGVSPTFNAFELAINRLTNGSTRPDGANANFCSECHSPTAIFAGEVPDYQPDPDNASFLVDSFSPVSREALSCDFCHTVTGLDYEMDVRGVATERVI